MPAVMRLALKSTFSCGIFCFYCSVNTFNTQNTFPNHFFSIPSATNPQASKRKITDNPESCLRLPNLLIIFRLKFSWRTFQSASVFCKDSNPRNLITTNVFIFETQWTIILNIFKHIHIICMPSSWTSYWNISKKTQILAYIA